MEWKTEMNSINDKNDLKIKKPKSDKFGEFSSRRVSRSLVSPLRFSQPTTARRMMTMALPPPPPPPSFEMPRSVDRSQKTELCGKQRRRRLLSQHQDCKIDVDDYNNDVMLLEDKPHINGELLSSTVNDSGYENNDFDEYEEEEYMIGVESSAESEKQENNDMVKKKEEPLFEMNF